jgi:type IV secretion system protein VirB8
MDWFSKIKEAKIVSSAASEGEKGDISVAKTGVISSNNDKEQVSAITGWHTDQYQSTVVQRNLLFVVMLVCLGAILFSAVVIRYLKSTRTIEPFVIEVERKTGIATVVDPLTTKAYTGDEVIKRYYVMKYLKAREEYYNNLFEKNFREVVRLLSSDQVYGSDYVPKFNQGNPQSPYNTLGNRSWREISLKSMIFPTANSARVSFVLKTDGMLKSVQNKVAYLEFEFKDLQMNEKERLINPLGFVVTLYRLEDELQ